MRCREKKYTLDGWYRSKHEDRQRCRYSACGRRFWSNLGFEYRQVPRPYITPALMVWRRMAAANTQMTLRHLGRDARGRHNQDTGTPFHYFRMVGECAKRLKPSCVGDRWGAATRRCGRSETRNRISLPSGLLLPGLC